MAMIFISLTFTCYTINLLLLFIISTLYLFHIYIFLFSLDFAL